MKLNCKPGDLAIYVNKDFSGRIFTIVEKSGEFWWRVEPCPPYVIALHDKNLRPLRDQDGEDEMLRIAGLPNKESANV